MRAEQLNADAAGALVAGLVGGGVRDVVVSPGSRNTPLTLAVAGCVDLRAHVVLDERAAAFVALGLARASGRPVALACTSGSAGAHYLPALVEADADRIPLVALTADRPAELQACGAPQTIDQRRLFGRFVRHSRDLGSDQPVAAWRHAAEAALDGALGCPPGPVHLNLAFREPLWTPHVESSAPPPASPRALRGVPRLDDAQIGSISTLVAGARRGVVFCGTGAGPLPELPWPVLAEAASGARGEGSVWAYDALVRAGAPHPDVVIQVGRAPISKPTLAWLSKAARTVRVDPGATRHDPELGGGLLVAAESYETLARVRLPNPEPQLWAAAQRRVAEALAARDEVLWEGAVARALAARLPEGWALHLASSTPIRDVDGFVPRVPRATYASRGANGIDGTFATAAGEALAGGPLALLVGDLASLHDLGGLLAAANLGAPLLAVVVDNGGGGIFDHLPIAAHPDHERLFRTPQRADLGALARGCGATHTQVDDLGGLHQALDAALAAPPARPRVLQVVVDRKTDLAVRRALEDCWKEPAVWP